MGTVNNVQVAGPITVYTSTTTSEAPPADSVDFGTAWGGNWTDAGFTEGGATLEISGEDADIRVDQHLSAINTFPVSEEVKLTVRMAESTLENILIARGAGSISTDTNEDTLGLGTQANVNLYAVGVEGKAAGTSSSTNKYRRVILNKAKLERSLNIGMNKNDVQMLEVTFVGLVDSTESAGQEVGYVIDEN